MGVIDKLKGRMQGPMKAGFPVTQNNTSETNEQDTPVSAPFNSNDSAKMALNFSAVGAPFPKGASDAVIKQWYANNSTGPTLDADRLNDPNYNKDSLFTKLKTIVSNPFDSLTAIMGTNPDMQDLRQVRQLHEAKDRDDKDAKQVLARSSALNTASSFIPIAATADAIASTLEGDPTALVTKKLNKIKPIAKSLTKIKLDPKKTSKVLSTGLKVAKKI